MPQQPGDKIPKAWTIASIRALMEPRIKTLIRRQGDIGGAPVQHSVLGGLANDDHVQYLIDLPGTGGDGITVTARTIAVDLTDNTIMAKVGAAAAGPLAMAADTVLIRGGADVVAQAFVAGDVLLHDGTNLTNLNLTAGSVLVRQPGGTVEALSMPASTLLVRNPAGDIIAAPFAASSIFTGSSIGNFEDRTFAAHSFVKTSATGTLDAFTPGANKWIIADAAGAPKELIAFTDWMVVGGAANVPTFLVSAANALVGKFGSAATAFNTVAPNTLVGRLASGTDLNDLAVAVQQLMLRGSGDMAATTIGDTRWVGRPPGGNLGEVTPAESRVMLSLLYSSLLVPPGLHADTTTTKTSSANNRLQFVYVGKAGKALTTTVVICEVATAYTLTGGEASPWARIGVYTGQFADASSLTLTLRGSTDVTSTFNSTGRKTTTVALTGISEGDDLWIMWGSETLGINYELRALLPDVVRQGVVQRANTTGDHIEQDPATTLLESGTFNPPWISMTAI